MPRDGNGNYTLPAGNPVVPGSLIEASWANTTMEDIAIALTNSLSRNGNGGMLAPLGFIDGSVNAPGMFFNTQVNMGLHRAALNDFRIVMDGASVAQFTDTFVNIQVPDLQVQGNSVITEAGGTIADLTADSIKIVGDAADTLDIDRNGADAASILLRNNDGGVRFRTDGADVSIIQTDSSGTAADTWITLSQNGAVALSFNDSVKLATTNTGVAVTGNATVSGGVTATGDVTGNTLVGNDVDIDSNTEILINANRTSASPARIVVTNSEGGVSLRTDGGGFQIYQTNSSGGAQDQWITGAVNGGVGLRYNNSQKLVTDSGGVDVSGTLQATGDVQAGVSDLRCKDVSSYINPRKCLNAVLNWGVIRYTEKKMHPDANTETPQIGLIAQELKKSFPELTCPAPFDIGRNGKSKSGEDYLTAKYDRTVSILVGAVQALQMDLEKMNRDIAKLRGYHA